MGLPQAFSPLESMSVPQGGFVIKTGETTEFSDSVDIIDPNLNIPRVIRNIITANAGVIKVTYLDGSIDVVPVTVGPNPMLVRRVWSTGTTAGIKTAGISVQY